jgi:hypothetical protein
MKVYIGPYKDWFGPYQLAEKILFWKDRDDDSVHQLGEWLAYGKVRKEPEPNSEIQLIVNTSIADHLKIEREKQTTWLYKFLLWIESKKKRKIEVRIDNYDTWSMDHTLSYIILPMLKQLKDTKHGAPFVDDKDVPKELRSTSAPAKENSWDIDGNHFKRWDWVLDQMIWSFEQKVSDEDPKLDDVREYKKHYKRMQNGFKLFGKYYQNLWD